jgi:hypothetical protein
VEKLCTKRCTKILQLWYLTKENFQHFTMFILSVH